MNLKPLLLVASSILSAAAAHAQIAEVYATANFTHISNVETGSILTINGVVGTYSEKFTSATPTGIGGGVTFNFLPLPAVKLGLDLRGSTRPGTVGADTALGGIKLTISPPLIKPKFFFEGAVGYLATRTVNQSNTCNSGASLVVTPTPVGGTFGNDYAIYQIIGGVDYPLIHFVDFRVEAAGGTSFGNGGFIGLGNSDGSSAKLFTVNTGFVVHF